MKASRLSTSSMRFPFAIAIAVLITLCPTTIHAQCTRSCGLGVFFTSLTVTPTTAVEGQPVSITIGVRSTFTSPKVFTATVNLVPTNNVCAAFAEAFSVSSLVYPYQYRIFTYTLSAPRCRSTYNVNMNGVVRATLTVN
jgi:hypothetical protein